MGAKVRVTRDLSERDPEHAREGLSRGVLGAGQNGGNRPEEWKLNQYAGDARYAARHRIDEAPRPPLQQQSRHDENEIVGVEIGDRRRRALGRKLVHQPCQSQCDDEQRRQRAVLQPLARPGTLRMRRARFAPNRSPAAAPSARALPPGAVFQAIQVLVSARIDRAQHRLPQENGLAERNHAGFREQRRRHAAGVRLQLRRGRGQTERPHRAHARAGRRSGGPIVHAQIRAPPDGARQQAREHHAQSPMNQRYQDCRTAPPAPPPPRPARGTSASRRTIRATGGESATT